MPEPSAKSKEKQKIPFFSRLQVKYALSYLALLAMVLVLLNTYPLIASQNLLISSKEDSLRSQIGAVRSRSCPPPSWSWRPSLPTRWPG